jgi:hypothetical protein
LFGAYDIFDTAEIIRKTKKRRTNWKASNGAVPSVCERIRPRSHTTKIPRIVDKR